MAKNKCTCFELESQNAKIAELERIIVEAKECVRTTQERNENLQCQLTGLDGLIISLRQKITDARQGAFGFMIKPNETLCKGMARNYQEFDNERMRLNKQILILKEMIIANQMAKLCWCDQCSVKRDMKGWKKKLEQELDGLLAAKEAQKNKPEIKIETNHREINPSDGLKEIQDEKKNDDL